MSFLGATYFPYIHKDMLVKPVIARMDEEGDLFVYQKIMIANCSYN